MKRLKGVFVTLLFLTVLTSDTFGQYAKLTKGQPNPFDTAVAVRIDRYRQEGLKLRIGNQLVDSLIREIFSLHSEIKIGDSISMLNARTIAILSASNTRKDSINQVIKTDFNKLYGIAEEQNKWYRRPEYYVGAFIVFELLKLFIPK
jgi:hypothetical protein